MITKWDKSYLEEGNYDNYLKEIADSMEDIMIKTYLLNKLSIDEYKDNWEKIEKTFYKIKYSRNGYEQFGIETFNKFKNQISQHTKNMEIILRCFKSTQKNSPLSSKLYQKVKNFTQELRDKNISETEEGFYLIRETSNNYITPQYHFGRTINLHNRISQYKSHQGIETNREIIIQTSKNGFHIENDAKRIFKTDLECFNESKEKLEQIIILKKRIELYKNK